MLWTQDFLPDLQSALVKQLRLGMFALDSVEPRQVDKIIGRLGMLWPQFFFLDLKNPFGALNGGGGFSLTGVTREISEENGYRRRGQ